MSRRQEKSKANIDGTRSRQRLIPAGLNRLATAVAILLVGTVPLFAQENPLRDGDAGYLQQLLPSLQKIQDDAAVGNSTTPAPEERFAPRPMPSSQGSNEQPFGGATEQAGLGSNAGLWRPDPAAQAPASPAASAEVNQTQASRTDSRPVTPWPGGGAANQLPGAATVAKSNPKSVSTAAGKTGSARNASTRAEGAGKLTAFQGVESLQLNSTVVKIALNTLLVLAASIGLILVVRRGLPRQAQTAKSQKGRLRIEQTLSLGGKAELKVVRCGLNQVLVAIDNGGIRSVVALEPGLEPGLDPERENLEPVVESQPAAPPKEPVNIEQFVKMIRDMEGDLMSARPGR